MQQVRGELSHLNGVELQRIQLLLFQDTKIFPRLTI